MQVDEPRYVKPFPFIDSTLFNMSNGQDFTNKNLMNNQIDFEMAMG
jgi:hypothetical protein